MNAAEKAVFERSAELMKKRYDNKEMTQNEYFRWAYENRDKIMECADRKAKILFKATLPLLKWAASQ